MRSDNIVDYMIAWEEGLLDQEDVIDLFQELYDDGIIEGLQGCYYRQLRVLVDQGLVTI